MDSFYTHLFRRLAWSSNRNNTRPSAEVSSLNRLFYLVGLLLVSLLSMHQAQAQVNVALSVSDVTKVVNTPFTYTLDIVCPSTTGTCTNAVVTFPLHSSLDYIGASPVTGNVQSISYNSANNTVTVTMNPAINGTTDQVQFVVNFKPSTFTGTIATGIAYGGPGLTNVSNIVTTTALNGQTPPTFYEGLQLRKTACGGFTTAMPGGGVQYCLAFGNLSQNNALTNFVMEDVFPANFVFSSIIPFYHYTNLAAGANVHYDMYYKTNTNGTYTLWPGGPYSLAGGNEIPVSVLGLASGEKVTAIKWVFTDPIPGTEYYSGTLGTIYGKFDNTAVPGTTIDNCLTGSGTMNGNPAPVYDGGYALTTSGSCYSYNIIESGITALFDKYRDPAKAGYVADDIIDFVITHNNQGYSAADIKDFKIIDLLPGELDYVSSVVEAGGAGFLPSVAAVTAVVPTITPNFNGSGKTRILWDFTGITEQATFANHDFKIRVKAKVKKGVPTGVINNEAYLSIPGNTFIKCNDDNQNPKANYSSVVDATDLNGDGSTTDSLCKVIHPATLVFPTGAGLESIKWVKGTLDTDYSRFPNSGQTSPGGTADYKMSITNKGNVAMKDIKIIDILPFVGDKGVIDLSARNTQWRPFLIAPVTTTAPNLTIYYSTAQNPCRDELTPGVPAGCTPPNWSTTLPADPTTVQSLKFDFGATVMQPNDAIELFWSMRAPIDAPTNGEIAWNSFGYITSRNDNGVSLLASEPIKVGIAVKPIVPAGYGNYVWKDKNKNGLQDETPADGINGVRVDLYKAAGATPNIATDQQVTFTLTSSKNGEPGYYQFTNLAPGNYYAVFHKPLNNCVITTPNVASTGDELDSDGIQTIVGGDTLAITAITTLDAGEIDFTWDLGLAPAVDPCAIAAVATPGTCDPATNLYSVTGSISLTGAVAGTATITDGVSTTTVMVTAGATSVPYSLAGLASGTGSHTVTVSLPSCGTTTATYSAPASCTVAPCGLAMVVTPGLCLSATNSYVLSGSITATNVPTAGTLTISSGAFSSRTLSLPTGNASGTFSYSGLVSDGQTYTVTASYSDTACSPVSQVYTAPASCSVAPPCSLSATATAGLCVPATNAYTASVVVNLTNGVAGTLTVSIPGATPITQTLAANTGSFTAVFAGLPSDGATHTATISLPGCGTTTATFTAPASCALVPVCSISPVATAGICQTATNTYSSTVVVTVLNPSAGTLTVTDGAQTLTFSTTANAQNTFTATFNGLTSDGTTHTVTASLPDCSSATTTYSAPASCSIAPVCSISAVATVGLCQTATNTYSSTVVVTVNNPSTGTITIADGAQTQTFSTTASAQNTFTVIFPSLLSTGTTHTVTASLPGCSTATTTYTAPASCSVTPICNLSLTASGTNCNPTTNLYVLSGAITLTNSPTSQTITLTDGSYVRSLTAAAGTTTINYSYTTLQSDGAIHTVTLTSSSCGTASTTYTAPASCTSAPVCSVSAVATAGSCATATNTYSSTVLVTLTNPTAGTMTVTNGVNSITFVVPASVGTVTTSAVFNGLVSDGASHTVTVSLPGCSTTTATYTAPASCSTTQVCSVSAVVTAGSCASATNTYSATAVVTVKNSTAGTLMVTSGAQSLTFATTAVSSATFTAVFNGLPADGASHSLIALLLGCSSTTTTYTAPVSCSAPPACLVNAVATAGSCASATSTYSATTVVTLTNPTVGVLTITNGAQSLTFATTAVNSSTITATFTNLPADGASHTVTVSLPGCSSTTTTYTAPTSCSTTPVCSVSLTTNSLPIGIVGQAYSATLTATGGTAPYSFSLASGSLPTGLTLSNTGVISGTPTAAGSFSTTIRITDSQSCSAIRPLAVLQIELAPVCSLTATATPGTCSSATNTYTVSGSLSLTNNTAGGTIFLTDGVQSSTVSVASGATTVPYSLTGLVSDGSTHTVVATLSGCGSASATYTAPGSCTQPAGTKLSLEKLVNKSKAKLGDVLTYTLVLTNIGTSTASNVVVTDSSTIGLTYVANSATAPAGTTFTQGAPISTWKVATLTAGQSVSLTFQAKADSSGILFNKAYIPGDTATVCTSIPVVMCAGDQYAFTLTAPAGRSSYKWFKDNVEIPGQTTNVLEVTAPGTYSLAVDNVSGKCPDFSCCPFIVEEDALPTFQAQAVVASCVGNVAQANGKIVLTGFNPAYTYQYSLGSSFNEAAPLSGSAKVIPAGGVIVNNLANPVVAQAYTIRVYNASGCYTDVTVMLLPTVCGCPAEVCVPYVITQTKRAKRIGDPR